jgi:hypothetical protein
MWQPPKLDWTIGPIGMSDLNRWEGNIFVLHVRQGNLSFEYFVNNNPDAWTITASAGDSYAIDAANAVHGAYCLNLYHAANVNDGINAISQLFPISPLNTYYIGWALKAVAALKCDVQVYFYDRAKQYLSTLSLYSSTANPTTMIYHIGQVTGIPATARYMAIVIAAGNNSATAGDMYIDGLQINPIEIGVYPGGFNAALSGSLVSDSSYNTVTSQVVNPADIKLSNGTIRTNVLPLTVTVNYSITVYKNGQQSTGYGRIKVGDAYSTVITAITPATGSSTYGTGTASGSHVFTVSSLPVTVELQLKGQGVSESCSISISV